MEKKNVGFASGIGFILSAAGSAVGLGNLWAFPYKTAKNGGSAFVFMYIICVIVIGFIAMICEIHIGKRAKANTVSAYKKANKNIGWFGLLALLIPFFITCYYSVLGGYTIKYAVSSFAGNSGILESFSTNIPQVTIFSGVFIALAVFVISCGVKDGIEKMSKVLMPMLFIILLGVVVYSLCLGEGVKTGLKFYLYPDFSHITFNSVLASMSQAFYSLSIGMGILVSYGSYTGKEINIVRSTFMICLFDTVVALLSGLAIFPAVAHFDPSLLESSAGIGLIFAILPDVFSSMGIVGTLISFMFFAMVAIAALTSVISLIEVTTQFVIQRYKVSRKSASLIITAVCFAVSVPIGISLGKVGICGKSGLSIFGLDYLTFLDEVTNTVVMPVVAFLSCITVGWIITPKVAIAEMEAEGSKLGWIKKVFGIMVRYITPALIIVVEIGGVAEKLRSKQYGVVGVAYTLIIVSAIIYYIFFRNSDAGTNADEAV